MLKPATRSASYSAASVKPKLLGTVELWERYTFGDERERGRVLFSGALRMLASAYSRGAGQALEVICMAELSAHAALPSATNSGVCEQGWGSFKLGGKRAEEVRLRY